MPLEIERKFLVAGPPPVAGATTAAAPVAMRQGYLALDPVTGTEARVRQTPAGAVLTIKSAGDLVRVEEEVPLGPEQFERLWPLTEGRRVEKTRTLVPLGDGRHAEHDVYGGDLAGLETVEVEFPDEAASAAFVPPPWFGPEVTTDARYKNHALAVDGLPAG